MNNVIIIVSRFIFIMIIAYYTFVTYRDLYKNKNGYINMVFKLICVCAFNILASYALLFAYEDVDIIMFLFTLFVCTMLYLIIFCLVYKGKCLVIAFNISMLLSISEVMIYRLSRERALKHLIFIVAGMVLSLVMPYIAGKIIKIKNIHIIAGILGILLLFAVAIIGEKNYGALLSISIFNLSFQPIEIIKPIYVLLLAGILRKSADIKNILTAGIWTLLYIGILAYANDFGSVLILVVVFVVLVYISTQKSVYIITGAVFTGIIGIVSVKYVSHIQTRFEAWIDPFSLIDDKGYQMCQSLFAIVSGGFLGRGLTLGMPEKIPVVEKDFIFSAICEEFGAIFGICLILICLATFISIGTYSKRQRDNFGKYTLLGLGVIYIFQILLTIGGAIDFLPSTGVTLPFVSYGLTSLICLYAGLGFVQNIYIRNRI